MVPAGFSSFERYNRATIMSATATGGRSRVPRSWPAFWQRQTRRVVRLQWQRRRTLLVVVLMAGVGLGSSGVNAVSAAGASHGVRAQSAEAATINAHAGRLASQHQGNQQGQMEQGRPRYDSRLQHADPATVFKTASGPPHQVS